MVLLLGVFLACGSTSNAAVAEIVIGAAVSLREPVEEMVRDFRATHPEAEIQVVFGASSTLARQIEFGAPLAIFLSADPQWIDHLIERSLIDEEDAFQIASNQLWVVKKKGSELKVADPADLFSAPVERLALPPESVPLGRYARLWLEGHDANTTMPGDVVITEHAQATLAAVENGHADAALVYRTDALRSTEVDVAYEIPASEQPEIVYSGVLLRSARANKQARDLLAYLKSPRARKILDEAGFGLQPSPETGPGRSMRQVLP